MPRQAPNLEADAAESAHYIFVHHWIPGQALRGLPFLRELAGPEGAQVLQNGWEACGQLLGHAGGPVVQFNPRSLNMGNGGENGVWYRLPEPGFLTGAYLQALVPDPSGRVSVFQAELAPEAEIHLCGWLPGRTRNAHLEFGRLPSLSVEAFLEAIRTLAHHAEKSR